MIKVIKKRRRKLHNIEVDNVLKWKKVLAVEEIW